MKKFEEKKLTDLTEAQLYIAYKAIEYVKTFSILPKNKYCLYCELVRAVGFMNQKNTIINADKAQSQEVEEGLLLIEAYKEYVGKCDD